MADIRAEIHEDIDLMPDYDLVGLKKFLDTYPSGAAVTCRRAPYDDEPVTEADRIAIREAEEWFDRHGGRGIPHEEIMREFDGE